jgi:FAD/FMN-containing dehydrogenase
MTDVPEADRPGSSTASHTDALLDRLERVVGAAHVITDPDVRRSYEVDWTGRYAGEARAVIRPASTSEVVEILRMCHAAGCPIVPQGGNTGLVGGGVPVDEGRGAIVMSLRRLDRRDAVDLVSGQVTVGAGVTLAALQRHVRGAGWDFGVDLGARDSATVGGMIATNAGGLRLVRYGGMRQQVVGLEAVLADGRRVERLGGLLKDNTGYDLAGLMTGSEGTLAVITRARLRLVAPQPNRAVAVVGLNTLADALEVVVALRAELTTLDAVEVFFADGLRLVCERAGLRPPFEVPTAVYLLIETADRPAAPDPAHTLSEAIARLGPRLVVDASIVTEPAARRELWRLREAHTEVINALGAEVGAPHKLDVTLPAAALVDFVDRVSDLVATMAPSAKLFLFGHLADGNLHVNVLGPDADDDRVDDAVLRLVVDLGGSISAEHGIGRAKRRWLELDRGPVAVEAMRAIRRALDPRAILNPGVLVSPDGIAAP